jgi:hypothetical protein
MDNGYQSELYYDVVIQYKEYKGWRAHDVGLGMMRFIHRDHDNFIVNKGSSIDWMKECWDDFIAHADNLDQ